MCIVGMYYTLETLHPVLNTLQEVSCTELLKRSEEGGGSD